MGSRKSQASRLPSPVIRSGAVPAVGDTVGRRGRRAPLPSPPRSRALLLLIDGAVPPPPSRLLLASARPAGELGVVVTDAFCCLCTTHNPAEFDVAEILKDRPSWYCDCRSIDIIHVIPTGNGGTIELIYMQV
uniref:Uncharacterized protein n=1 Tax=Oryza meridionalis TaxID=40149 RepID=A0A0E0FAW4_9ORYZ